MNPILQDIYATNQVVDLSGERLPLLSSITVEEGEMLTRLIGGDRSIRRTLEIGCAYGISSLFICESLAGRDGVNHTVLDPFQFLHWNGIGIENLRRAGYHFARVVTEKSEFDLPLMAKQEAGTYDLVFIDGWHSFDQVIVDIYYANLLLRVGGYMVLDDNDVPAVRRAIACLSKYPAYEIVESVMLGRKKLIKTLARPVLNRVPSFLWPVNKEWKHRIKQHLIPTMIALKKVQQDDRPWDWYEPF